MPITAAICFCAASVAATRVAGRRGEVDVDIALAEPGSEVGGREHARRDLGVDVRCAGAIDRGADGQITATRGSGEQRAPHASRRAQDADARRHSEHALRVHLGAKLGG